MEFTSFLAQIKDLPLISSSLLQVGDASPAQVHKQLSRWTKSGKLIQLRRGLYVLAEPYRKEAPHPFTVANQLLEPSYISLQSALAYYELIPEAVPTITSVTSRKRTQTFQTPLGHFGYRSIQRDLFSGFRLVEMRPTQWAFLARPEKAVLDLVYLTPKGEQPAFINTLRLQNWDLLDLQWMQDFAAAIGKPKLIRAVDNLAQAAVGESYKTL
jgi:predicted transcriptional regulator of viral defense system